jgi:hypothetical protein
MEGVDYNHNGIDIGSRGGDNLGAHQIDVATVPTDPGELIVPTGPNVPSVRTILTDPNELTSLEEAEREQERDITQINLVLADLELQKEIKSLLKEALFFKEVEDACEQDEFGDAENDALTENPSDELLACYKKTVPMYLRLDSRLIGVRYRRNQLIGVAESLARLAFPAAEYARMEGAYMGLFAYARDFIDRFRNETS